MCLNLPTKAMSKKTLNWRYMDARRTPNDIKPTLTDTKRTPIARSVAKNNQSLAHVIQL